MKCVCMCMCLYVCVFGAVCVWLYACACMCVGMCNSVDLPLQAPHFYIGMGGLSLSFIGPVTACASASPSVPCDPISSEEGQPMKVMTS